MFLTQDMRRIFFTQIYRDFDGDAMLAPIRMAARRKPTETSVTEFCYKSVNLSLDELKNVFKITLFLIHELFR